MKRGNKITKHHFDRISSEFGKRDWVNKERIKKIFQEAVLSLVKIKETDKILEKIEFDDEEK